MPEVTITFSGDAHYMQELREALKRCIDDGEIFIVDSNDNEPDSISYSDKSDTELTIVIEEVESEDE